MEADMENIAKYFDHTILKPDADITQVDRVITEAVQKGLASVCVNQYRTKMVQKGIKEKK